MANIKKDIPNDRMAKYLANMDFKLMKKQKTDLLNLQAKIEKPNAKFTQKDFDVLEGCLNLFDSIQDIAVDEYGYDKNKIFKFPRKEK